MESCLGKIVWGDLFSLCGLDVEFDTIVWRSVHTLLACFLRVSSAWFLVNHYAELIHTFHLITSTCRLFIPKLFPGSVFVGLPLLHKGVDLLLRVL